MLPIFFLFFISLASAAPAPFETQTYTGLQFAYSPYDIVQENTDFKLHVHVINDTAVQTNTTTSCLLHLYDSKGNHILKAMLGYETPEFEYTIAGGNFTVGEHAYIIQCNNTNKEIHLVSGLFDVTASGNNTVDPVWLLVIALVFTMILVLYGFVREEHPPITIGGVLFMVIALYIWVNGFGALAATDLIPRFMAAALFVVGATLSIKSLSELK